MNSAISQRRAISEPAACASQQGASQAASTPPRTVSRPVRTSVLKTWTIRLAAPVGLAALTVYAVNQYMNDRTPAAVPKVQPIMLERLVASADLKAQTILDVEHLALRDIPEHWVGPDSIAPEEVQGILGMQLTEDLMAGMPLTFSKLRRPQPNEYLHKLAPDRRAVTLPVSRINSSSGLIQAGELIDLYVTFEHRGRRITSLLMTQIMVLQVARPDHDRAIDAQETLTLDVSPEQAAKLIAAQQGGTLAAVQLPNHAQASMGQTSDPRSGPGDNRRSRVVPAANHLPGFAGVEPSFEQHQAPEIMYGDQEPGPGQDHR